MVDRPITPGRKAVETGVREAPTREETAEAIRTRAGAVDITDVARAIEAPKRAVTTGGGAAFTPVPKVDSRSKIIAESRQKISRVKKDIQQEVTNLKRAVRDRLTQNIRNIKNINQRLELQKQTQQSLQNIDASRLQFTGRLDTTAPEDIQVTSIEDLRTEFFKLPGVKQIKQFEEKQAREGKGLQLREERVSKGGSLTQKGFELVGFKFFKPGEKEEIIEKTLSKLTSATTIEEQEKAIKELTDKGIGVDTEGGDIVVDIEGILPSKPFSNFFIQTSDALLKGKFFGPLISVGAAAKAKAKVGAKAKQKKIVPKKKAEAIIKKLEDRFKKEGSQGLQEDLNTLIKRIETSKTGDKQLARDNVKRLFKELEKKQLTKDLVLAERDGRIGIVKQSSIISARVATKSIKKEATGPTVRIELETFRVPKLRAVEEIIATPKIPSSIFNESAINKSKQTITSLNKDLQRNRQRQNLTTSQFERQSLKSKERQITKQIQKERQKLQQKQTQSAASSQKLDLKQQLKQKGVQRGASKPFIKVKASPKLKFVLPGLLIGLKKKKEVVKKRTTTKRPGYLAFAKQRGKFIKISKVPVSKKKARDISAFFVDKTLSATGFIKKANKTARKPNIKVPGNYFNKTRFKYRNFKIFKGEKVDLKNTFIEKRKFRLDQKRETQTIQALRKRLLKKAVKKSSKKTSKKSSNPSNKKPFEPDKSMLSKRRRLKK